MGAKHKDCVPSDVYRDRVLQLTDQVQGLSNLVRVKQEQVDTAEHLARLEVQEDLTRIQKERDEALADRASIAAAFRGFLEDIQFWKGELDSL